MCRTFMRLTWLVFTSLLLTNQVTGQESEQISAQKLQKISSATMYQLSLIHI